MSTGEMELSLIPKTYMVDTNVFRYYSYKIGDLSSGSERARDEHKQNARAFWRSVLDETSNKKSIVMASVETQQELTVQAHTLKTKESRKYNKLLEQLHIETSDIPRELEYHLRDFSNYVRSKYSGILVPKGNDTEYLQASDARIFIHAFLNDAILVTGNIKDFFLYPLFYEENEDEVLYDISSRQYKKLLPEGRKSLESDERFQEIKTELWEFKNT